MKKLSMLGMMVGAALLCAAPISAHWSPAQELRVSLDTAQARLGRPLTPASRSTAECIGAHITALMVPITAAIIIRTMLTAVRIITVDIIATET